MRESSGTIKFDSDARLTRHASFIDILRYARLLDYILLTCGITLSVVNGALSPLSSVLFGALADTLIAGQASFENGTFSVDVYTHSMLNYLTLYTLLAAILFLVGLSSMNCFFILSERQAHEIRKKYFAAVLKQEMTWYDKKETGALTNNLSSGIERIKDGIGDKLGVLLHAFAQLVFGVIVGLYYSLQMTLLTLLVAPLITLLLFGSIKILKTTTRNEMRAYDKAASIASEIISNIRTVTSFNAQYAEVARYEECLKCAQKVSVKGIFIVGIFTGLYIFLLFASIGFGFWYGTNLVIKGEITPGTVFTVFWAIMVGAIRLGQAIPQIAVITTAKFTAGEIFQLIDQEPKINCMSPGGLAPSHLEGRIEFQNVHFCYPARPNVKILNGTSFTVKPGSTVALVGHSGSGKSTVVALLLRFYDQQAGRIMLDGVSVRDFNIEWLRSQIGLVSQEPTVFTGTIEENLKLDNERMTKNEMIEACMKANAHDFIMKLPDGYKTLIGEGGIQLSGGQKQRIAIARILFRNPKILLFDEATSALDSESEASVQQALDRVRAGHTTIMIAHRLSTIRNADQIMVFKNGEIIESGLHDELMALDGVYRQSVQAQEIEEGDNDIVDNDQSLSVYRPDDNERQLRIEGEDSKMPGERFCGNEGLRESNGSRTSYRNQNHSAPFPDISTNHSKKRKITDASFFDILKFVKKELPFVAVALVFTIVRALSWPIFSIVYGRTFLVLSSLDKDEMAKDTMLNLILYLILGIVSGVSTFFSGTLFSIAGEKMSMRLRIAIFTNILRQDFSFFDNEYHSVGKLATHLTTDVQNIKAAMDQRMAEALQGIISFCVGMVVAFSFGWRMALFCVAICCVFIILQSILVRYLKILRQKDIKTSGKTANLVSESIENIRTVQYLTMQKKMYKSYCLSLEEPQKRAIIQGFWQSMSYSISFCFVPFNFSASYFFGLWLVRNSWAEPYNVFQVIEALNMASFTVLATASFLPDYVRARISASLAFHIKNQVPLIDNLSQAGIEQNIEGNIRLKSVCFAYPMLYEHPILKNFSMSAKFGQKIALVGPSGSGKSTVIKLLERFYDVTEGALLIDNRDIKSYNVRHLRSHIALVDQEPILFNGSIRYNIAYGLTGVSQDEIETAAKLVNMHTFITTLPQGYETIVGSKGSHLSGGQKQRIAIARAIIRNPKILLLDEATSALDTENEKIIQEALERARRGRTCIVIAHRLKTVQNADLIIVLKDGLIVECGNHTQLLEQKGLYCRLVGKQKIS